WDATKLRARVAVIFQDFNEYQLDVRENVGVGSLPHMTEEERIERAAARGGADEVVKGLVEGFGTKLGRWAHDGVELSAGQWRRASDMRTCSRCRRRGTWPDVTAADGDAAVDRRRASRRVRSRLHARLPQASRRALRARSSSRERGASVSRGTR